MTAITEAKLGDGQEGTAININTLKGFAYFKPNIGVTNTIISPLVATGNFLANNNRVSVIIGHYENL